MLSVGHPTILSEMEEAYIVQAILFCAFNGWSWNGKDCIDFCHLENRVVPWKEMHPEF
jgi:hypothetical protein